ncbi:MAG: ORF6N domain-containing protein [Deltaproteobacteria bacterium]|nr:ORF6N domain-containing protein [Deltaproteobacteria bacterium]
MVSRREGSAHVIASVERIESQILLIRGQRVLLDADLAKLYGVPTKVLNQAVKRNTERFPVDFAFRLTLKEAEIMRSQFVTASKRNVRYRPYAFTEHGTIMAANVLNSCRAVEASVYVVRAFVRLRQVVAEHKELVHTLAELERRVGAHDAAIRELVGVIRRLAAPPPTPPRPRIGFHGTGM